MQPTATIQSRKRITACDKHSHRPARVRRLGRGSVRACVAEAFRLMAHGLEDKAAYARTVQFYCSSGREWTKQLG